MEYVKPWLSYEEQANLLEKRGLAFDRADLIMRLSEVGYYRLSGYWYIFKRNQEPGDESFVEGTDIFRYLGFVYFRPTAQALCS